MTVFPDEVGADTIIFSSELKIFGRQALCISLNYEKLKKLDHSGLILAKVCMIFKNLIMTKLAVSKILINTLFYSL